MSDPLAAMFSEFLAERIFLHNITRPTQEWYRTTWKAFQAFRSRPEAANVTGAEDAALSKALLHAYVVFERGRGVSARSVNTHLQALNAFARWLHEERGLPRVRLGLLRTEKRLIPPSRNRTSANYSRSSRKPSLSGESTRWSAWSWTPTRRFNFSPGKVDAPDVVSVGALR